MKKSILSFVLLLALLLASVPLTVSAADPAEYTEGLSEKQTESFLSTVGDASLDGDTLSLLSSAATALSFDGLSARLEGTAGVRSLFSVDHAVLDALGVRYLYGAIVGVGEYRGATVCTDTDLSVEYGSGDAVCAHENTTLAVVYDSAGKIAASNTYTKIGGEVRQFALTAIYPGITQEQITDAGLIYRGFLTVFIDGVSYTLYTSDDGKTFGKDGAAYGRATTLFEISTFLKNKYTDKDGNAIYADNALFSTLEQVGKEATVGDTLTLTAPYRGEESYTYHEKALTYLSNGVLGSTALNATAMPLSSTTERDAYVPVTLSWESSATVTGYTLTWGIAGEDTETVALSADTTSYKLYNLFKSTAYQWSLTASYEDGTSETLKSWFYMSDLGPRVAHLDGLTNLRDLGGYMTPDGRTVQGLLYRSAHLDYLTEQGVLDNDTYLGIKTDMDLRWGQTYPDNIGPLGAHRNWQVVGLSAYGAIADDTTGKLSASYLAAFRFLADEENYPIVFHCAGGADRTGTLAFMVNALLGVSYTELIQDYEFTTFSCPDKQHNRRYMDGYVGQASQSLGMTMHKLGYDCPTGTTGTGEIYYIMPSVEAVESAEKSLQTVVEEFLLDGGVTAEEIALIKAIFLGLPTDSSASVGGGIFIPAVMDTMTVKLRGYNPFFKSVTGVTLDGDAVDYTLNEKTILIDSEQLLRYNGTVNGRVSFSDGSVADFTCEILSGDTQYADTLFGIEENDVLILDKNSSDCNSKLHAYAALRKESTGSVGYGDWVALHLRMNDTTGGIAFLVGNYGFFLRASSVYEMTMTAMSGNGIRANPISAPMAVSNIFYAENDAILYFRVVEKDDTTMTGEFYIVIDGEVAYSHTKDISKLSTHIDSADARVSIGFLTQEYTVSADKQVLAIFGSLDAHTHGYVTDHKDATCTEDGYTVNTCACGHSTSEVHLATGHSFEDGVCTGCGITWAYCDKTEYSVIDGDLAITLSEMGDTTVTGVTFGGKDVAFTEEDGVLTVSAAVIDALGIATGKVTVTVTRSDSTSKSFDLNYTHVLYADDLFNFGDRDVILLGLNHGGQHKNDLHYPSYRIESAASVGYGDWVVLHLRMAEPTRGVAFLIGNYGFYLRAQNCYNMTMDTMSGAGNRKTSVSLGGRPGDAFWDKDDAILYFRVIENDDGTVTQEFRITSGGSVTFTDTRTVSKLTTHIASDSARLTLGFNTGGDSGDEADRIMAIFKSLDAHTHAYTNGECACSENETTK